MSITPDLEVWLISDPDTCAQWRQLARHVSLGQHVPRLEVTCRRHLRRESEKLSEVLRLWRQSYPDSYTVHTLLSVLDLMVRHSLQHALAFKAIAMFRSLQAKAFLFFLREELLCIA